MHYEIVDRAGNTIASYDSFRDAITNAKELTLMPGSKFWLYRCDERKETYIGFVEHYCDTIQFINNFD